MFVAATPHCQLPWPLREPMLEDDSLCSLQYLANRYFCSMEVSDKFGAWSGTYGVCSNAAASQLMSSQEDAAERWASVPAGGFSDLHQFCRCADALLNEWIWRIPAPVVSGVRLWSLDHKGADVPASQPRYGSRCDCEPPSPTSTAQLSTDIDEFLHAECCVGASQWTVFLL